MAKPPERPTSELDEVERAISVLGGRHPEHERTRRETLAAAEQRKKALDRELGDNARRRRRRALLWIALSMGVASAAVVAWKLGSRTLRVREALTRDEAPFVALGIQEMASNQLMVGRILTVEAPPSSCLYALATDGKVVVHAGASTLTGGRSAGFCTCAGGPVTIEASGAGEGPTGLALLRQDGKDAGGLLARPWATARPDVWGDSGAECADAMLDGWIAEHHFAKPALLGNELDTVSGAAALRADGLRVTTRVAEGMPFTVVEAAAGDCEVVIAAGAQLSLRSTGGDRRIERAPDVMAWCESLPDTLTVWATGGSKPVLVLSAPSIRLGGLLGTVEGVRQAGYTLADAASWLRVEDQGWEASTILRSSTVTDVVASSLATDPGGTGSRVAAVAAVVAGPSSGVTWETRDPVACDPPLGASKTIDETVCAPSTATTLWMKGTTPGCAARGTLPPWMSTLAQHHESDAVARIPELLTLARRLTREGFEPTTFEGVTETRDGARVAGRAGEDAVVAVGLSPKAPWVLPYSDGVPWDLGDAPREVPLKPGAAVALVATPPPAVPMEKRRTVVWRHAARP